MSLTQFVCVSLSSVTALQYEGKGIVLFIEDFDLTEHEDVKLVWVCFQLITCIFKWQTIERVVVITTQIVMYIQILYPNSILKRS